MPEVFTHDGPAAHPAPAGDARKPLSAVAMSEPLISGASSPPRFTAAVPGTNGGASSGAGSVGKTASGRTVIKVSQEQFAIIHPARAGSASGDARTFIDIQIALGGGHLTEENTKTLRDRLVSLYSAATDPENKAAINYILKSSPALASEQPAETAKPTAGAMDSLVLDSIDFAVVEPGAAPGEPQVAEAARAADVADGVAAQNTAAAETHPPTGAGLAGGEAEQADIDPPPETPEPGAPTPEQNAADADVAEWDDPADVPVALGAHLQLLEEPPARTPQELAMDAHEAIDRAIRFMDQCVKATDLAPLGRPNPDLDTALLGIRTLAGQLSGDSALAESLARIHDAVQTAQSRLVGDEMPAKDAIDSLERAKGDLLASALSL